MKYDILCVGDATLDIIMAGIPEDIFSRDSTLASTSKWLVGGDAANQACTFDALGMKTALTAKIGTDLVGNTIYQMLSESTIDLSYMIRTPRQSQRLLCCCSSAKWPEMFSFIHGRRRP